MDSSILLYRYTDIIASILSIITNLFLLFTIWKSNEGKNLMAYSYMFLVTAVLDALFSVVELFGQHQLFVLDGILYVMAYGIEQLIHKNAYLLIQFLHLFLIQNCILILAAQYKFRFDLIKSNSTNGFTIIKYQFIICVPSLITGSLGIWSAYMSKERGVEYYQNKLAIYNKAGASYCLYAFDMNDTVTKFMFIISFMFSSTGILVSVYYFWHSFHFVHSSGYEPSERTKKLQAQFTKTLLVQTLNSLSFSVFPILMMSISMLFKLNFSFVGPAFLMPINFLPFANAFLTLFLVKPYRKYVLQNVLCCVRNKQSDSRATSNVESNPGI